MKKEITRDTKPLDITTLMPIINQMAESITDPAEKQKVKTDAINQIMSQIQANNDLTVINNEDSLQNAYNVAAVQSASLFVSGWKPCIGWICAFAILYQFILVPIISWFLLLFGVHILPVPELDNTLWQLVFAMLGLGGLHTYEKAKGLPRDQYKLFRGK